MHMWKENDIDGRLDSPNTVLSAISQCTGPQPLTNIMLSKYCLAIEVNQLWLCAHPIVCALSLLLLSISCWRWAPCSIWCMHRPLCSVQHVQPIPWHCGRIFTRDIFKSVCSWRHMLWTLMHVLWSRKLAPPLTIYAHEVLLSLAALPLFIPYNDSLQEEPGHLHNVWISVL